MSAPDPSPAPSPDAGGVSAIVDRDYGESITAVYPTEVDALRALNGRGFGRVVALPWGLQLSDLPT